MTEKLVIDTSDLANLVRQLMKEEAVAVDTESNSFFGYPEKVCLIQLATDSDAWLIDPLLIDDMSPLGELLESSKVQKIIHAAENDLRVIDRDLKFNIRNIFDTSIASKFCGYEKSGLEVVLERTIGVVIDKNKKLQRANWSLRPLSQEAFNYAITDVVYLIKLRDGLVNKLEELGRLDWVQEEFIRIESVRYLAPESPETAFLSMKGSYALKPEELSVLKAIYMFRDLEARRIDTPPFKVIPNEVLVYLSKNPHARFDKVPGLSRKLPRQFMRRLKSTIEDGLKGDGIARPVRGKVANKVRNTEYSRRLKDLKHWREGIGKQLNLDPPLIWPTNSLSELAQLTYSIDQTILESDDIRAWQKGQFGDSIRKILADL